MATKPSKTSAVKKTTTAVKPSSRAHIAAVPTKTATPSKAKPIAVAAKAVVKPAIKSAPKIAAKKVDTKAVVSAPVKAVAPVKNPASAKTASGKKAFSSSVELNAAPLPTTAKGELPKSEPKLEKDLVKKPGGSLQSPLRIFQIYYEAWQRELLDPQFIALDNSKSNSEMLEFSVFEQLSKSDYIKGADLWGALSWRFTEKTGMSGADWIKAIESKPNHDVYFCNPYPENEALFHNMWLHGETRHPQFLALVQALFKVTGLPEEELLSILVADQFAAANYIVATPKFWNAYLPWVTQVMSAANKNLPSKVRDLMHSKQADEGELHKGATYVPFIVERLFPIFLKVAGKSFKTCKIALPERERELNVHLKLLREMKDVAHKTKSIWLAACWVNYRNLYLTQVNGKEWCEKHLRNITPTEIKFS